MLNCADTEGKVVVLYRELIREREMLALRIWEIDRAIEAMRVFIREQPEIQTEPKEAEG